MKTTNGVIPYIHGISEEEIKEAVNEYRERSPNDDRSNLELRPLAINHIISEKEE